MLGVVELCSGGIWVMTPRGQLSGVGGCWQWAGGGPGGGFGGEVEEGMLPIVLVRLCNCCAFFNASNSCWSRNPSYSETALDLFSGSKLEDLAGEGEWM